MFYINDEEYELCSDTEIDMLLADLPIDLIKEQLKAQINNPLYTNVNYIETVYDKFRLLSDEYGENEDAVRNINKFINDFFLFIINKIDERFGLDINVDESCLQEVIETGLVLYNYLILRYKKNITRFLYKFIMKNKKRLVEEFEGYKKKDVTSISLKKKIKNKDDVLILSNLPYIIKYILDLEIEPLDFLDYSSSNSHYEGLYITKLIEEGNLIGNFVDKYLEVIKQNRDVLDEVLADVKLKILKKM
jgi:hypothetical protein